MEKIQNRIQRMVFIGTKDTRKDGKRIREKNERTHVIQRDDVHNNGDAGETFKKVKKDTNREKRKRGNIGSSMDG